MARIPCTAALAALLVCGTARASGPVGGYLLVDRVVLSPTDAPTTIQVWGSFVLATDRTGRTYGEPQRGYLYYRAPQGKEEVCRREWNDLKKAAGTDQVIAFGTSYAFKSLGKVRRPRVRPEPEVPDAYPVDNGLERCSADTNYAPIRNLLALPAPRTPADAGLVPPGAVTLVVRNIPDRRHPRARYVFDLRGASGDREEATVEAGDRETRWTPKLKLKPGVKYTWHVRAVEGNWRGPVATSRFVVKGQK